MCGCGFCCFDYGVVGPEPLVGEFLGSNDPALGIQDSCGVGVDRFALCHCPCNGRHGGVFQPQHLGGGVICKPGIEAARDLVSIDPDPARFNIGLNLFVAEKLKIDFSAGAVVEIDISLGAVVAVPELDLVGVYVDFKAPRRNRVDTSIPQIEYAPKPLTIDLPFVGDFDLATLLMNG